MQMSTLAVQHFVHASISNQVNGFVINELLGPPDDVSLINTSVDNYKYSAVILQVIIIINYIICSEILNGFNSATAGKVNYRTGRICR